jgi:hypothetical protein
VVFPGASEGLNPATDEYVVVPGAFDITFVPRQDDERPVGVGPLPLRGVVGRGFGNAMRGYGDVASDNRHDSNPLPIGARVEARLAWSKLPSPSDHNCKPSRSSYPRVVFPKARAYL